MTERNSKRFFIESRVKINKEVQTPDLEKYKNQILTVYRLGTSDNPEEEILYNLRDKDGNTPDDLTNLYADELEWASPQETYDDGGLAYVKTNDYVDNTVNHALAYFLKQVAQIHGVRTKNVDDVDWQVVYDLKYEVYQALGKLGVKVEFQ
ncbi:hypothetical protein ACPV3A_16930 [Paenibacillus sp. Dod16]|uniref:hypothetical protein n=1 Tax=Paenibacillus sp. Dod16 TaxID=3416392 RepID=UPI003CF2A21A